MPATILPAQMVKVLDKLTALRGCFLGTSASGLGAGDGTFGASLKASDLAALVEGSVDAAFAHREFQSRLSTPTLTLANDLLADGILPSKLQSFFAQLNLLAGDAKTVDASILNLDSYMYWYNRGYATKNQCLAPPEFRKLFNVLRGAGRAGSADKTYPDPLNVYFVCQAAGVSPEDGTTMTNALAKFDVAAEIAVPGTGLTDGYTIPFAKYAGGFPFVKWTGGAGSGACSITVHGKNQAGGTKDFTLSGTWGSGAFVATQAGFALTPATTDDLITDSVTIVVTGMTAGVMYIEARAPSGRTYPAT